MRLDRDAMLNILAVLILLGFGAWFVMNTEWVEEEVPVQAQGEAAKDEHYAAKKLLQRLGGVVQSPLNLDRLPPPTGVLVLDSWSWDLFPERDEKLRRWVEAGGHLVMEASRAPKWAPVERREVKRHSKANRQDANADDEDADEEEDDDEPAVPRAAPAASAPASAPRSRDLPGPLGRGLFRRPVVCQEVQEHAAQAAAYGEPRSFKLCNGGSSGGAYVAVKRTVPSTIAQWTVEGPSGPAVMRVAVGRGSVTGTLRDWTDNHDIFLGDNPLVYVAMLQMRPGRELWFVSEEARPPLLKLIWQTGAPAVLLFGLLIGLILWRGGFRFGPRAPVPPLARRSVAEQIRGTAGFIFQRDATALHRAQLRVLEQAARRSIRDHDRLELRARAEAIAKATAFSADDLARAMNPTLKRTTRELVATLTLLETAARRLALNR